MNERYAVVSGYWAGEGEQHKADFFDLWYDNTLKGGCDPQRIFIINHGSKCLPKIKKGVWIDLNFNLGHTHDLTVNSHTDKRFCGWSMAFMIGALCSFAADCDMIFKEQDVLCFGNWKDRLYAELESTQSDFLLGPGDPPYKGQSCAQGLVIARRKFLPNFVSAYLMLPWNDSGIPCVETELKFTFLRGVFGGKMADMCFGHNSKRPPNWWLDPVFYAQRLTEQELQLLRDQKLL